MLPDSGLSAWSFPVTRQAVFAQSVATQIGDANANASASLISLSIRHFREGLLIEVYDTGEDPPVLSGRDNDAEGGRGLMLVDALSKEWSYFFPPGGGKVVYCFLETR